MCGHGQLATNSNTTCPTWDVTLLVVQSEGDINVYLELYLYRPLENVPRLPGFAKHAFVRHHGVPDMLGQPDWAAVGYRPGSQPQLLFVAESKTCQTLPIPPETTTAAVWQDTTSRGSIADAVDHVFGYMLVNDLRYSLLTSGEVFVFMQRNGRSLQVADIHRSRDMLTPMAAVYYLMHRQVCWLPIADQHRRRECIRAFVPVHMRQGL